ncbi:hypothetical protein ACFLVS_05385 [Chloroflexota bacterium]
MTDIFVPDPLQSDRQYERFYHLDLSGLEDRELTDELYALRPLLWGLDSSHWLRERVKALEAEISKRRGAARFEPSRQQKPKPAEGVKL